MHPVIAAELARQLIDERVRAGHAKPKLITPQRALVRDSVLRLPEREEQS